MCLSYTLHLNYIHNPSARPQTGIWEPRKMMRKHLRATWWGSIWGRWWGSLWGSIWKHLEQNVIIFLQFSHKNEKSNLFYFSFWTLRAIFIEPAHKKRVVNSARVTRFPFPPPLRRTARTPTGQACLGNIDVKRSFGSRKYGKVLLRKSYIGSQISHFWNIKCENFRKLRFDYEFNWKWLWYYLEMV